MATLNTLRTKGGLIVTIAIGVALVAFLIGEAGRSTPQGGANDKIGEINGHKITVGEYSDELDYLTQINKILTGSDALSSEQQEIVRNFTWKKMIDKYSLYPGYEKLGLEVTDAEMYDLVYGENISPILPEFRLFNDPQTGLYDKEAVREFISLFPTNPDYRRVWQYIENQVRDFALLTKYMELASGMVYVTDVQAERGAKLTNVAYDARYVGVKYESVPDSAVQVSAHEIKKYWEEHKNLYKQTASRDIEYVLFDVHPSVDDYTAASRLMDDMARELSSTDNVAQYVTLNSMESFDPGYYNRFQLSSDLAEFAFSADGNQVYGPVLEGDTYTLARVSDRKVLPDTVAIRQIILMPDQTVLADSILTALRSGSDFDKLSEAHSLMPDYADMGRVPVSFLPMEIVQEVETRNRFVRYDNPNGIVVFDIYYRTAESPKVQIGTIRYQVEPSNATQQNAYAQASRFYTNIAGSYDKFTRIAADSLYAKRVVRVRPTDNEISGFENSKELIRWTYNAKEGDVSGILELGGDYVIASLVTVREDGVAPVSQVTREVTGAVRKEKKAKMLADKMRDASSLEALSQGLDKPETGELNNVNFNTFYLPGIGLDHNVVGALASGLNQGELSRPVEGMTGVYVLQVTGKQTDEHATVAAERVRIEANSQAQIDQRLEQALIEMSQVKDNRIKYF